MLAREKSGRDAGARERPRRLSLLAAYRDLHFLGGGGWKCTLEVKIARPPPQMHFYGRQLDADFGL